MRSVVTSSFVERLNKFLGLHPEFDKLLFSQYLGLVVDAKDIYPLVTYPVNVGSSGSNVIVPAVPGKRILVDGGVIMSSGTVLVRWDSGSVALSGNLPLIANCGFYVPSLACDEGEALNLYLSATVDVDGWVSVRCVDYE